MTTGDMIRELRRLEEAHKADFVGTGETNWASMCHDVANRLEELLKAQEPVEPVFERQFMSDIEIYDCGKCGASLGAKGIAEYCMKCGQAVKWDG